MRKRLLTVASSAALILSSTAWAEQSSVGKSEMKEPSSEAAQAPAADPSPGEAADSKIRFGSYKSDPKAFSGQVAGGYSADELIGMNLVDAKGDSVGEVHDLLVSAENRIEKALVDVGGFIGVGEHRVALEIEKLELTKDSVFVADMTKEELEELPEYEQSESFWDEITK